MNNQQQLVEKLDICRQEAMLISQECKDRAHETPSNAHHVRLHYMMQQLADNIVTLNWAVMRLIDPHS